MTDKLAGKKSGAEIRRRFDQGVFLIGVGLREKDLAFERNAQRYPYSANFRHGLNIIAALCVEYAEEEAPRLLDGLSESRFIRDYCTRNVADWIEGWSEESRVAILQGETADLGPLADIEDGFFVPIDDCFDLILHVESDTLGAYQERKVYEFLRGGTQQHYVLGRRILVRNPIFSWDEYVAIKTGRRNFSDDILDQGEASAVERDWIVELLDMAYEEAPDGTKVCPRCGWTMAKRGRQSYCSSSTCCDALPSNYETLEDVSHGSVRLVRGVMHYISAPGGLELAIAEKARSFGLPFELWSLKDTCDVLVTLPDGTKLAIDAKTYGSAEKLARKIENDDMVSALGADEGIYVVPDDVERKRPGYCATCNRVLVGKDGYSCCTFRNFSRRMRTASKEVHS